MVNAEGTHSIYFLNSYFILSPYTKAVTQSDGKIELRIIKLLWGKCGDFFVNLMYKQSSDGNS